MSTAVSRHVMYAGRPQAYHQGELKNPDVRYLSERKSNLFDLIAIFILTALAGSRAVTVGTDTRVYGWIFDALPKSASISELLKFGTQEAGYTLLSYLVKSQGGSFTTLLWAASAITVTTAYWALRRTSKNFTLALAIFVMLGAYTIQFNTLRQGMAISILFLGATFLGKRRGWLIYTLLGLLATSFHSSALVATLLLALFYRWHLTISRLWVGAFLVIGLTAALWGSPWLLSIIEAFNPSYAVYVDWKLEAGVGLWLLIVARLALLVYALALRPTEDDMKYATWSALGIAWMIIGSQSLIVSRLSAYFLVFLCVLVPNAMQENKAGKMHVVVLLISGAIFMALNVTNFGDLVPYEFAP
ncbi:EpsG family protein [Microbacterium sp. NPDC089987]|uniref:EpsG family protein n=1 Tax=Microbacterium sp. NPDC089987 TaxID=3364202 RepID=UPI00380E297C